MMQSHFTLRTALGWFLGVAIVVACIGYILWQSRLLLTGPVITVDATVPTATSDISIEITGVAENIVWITLNGRAILTTATGNFKERIYLENGYTIVQLKAADRYGRTTTQTYPIVYTPLATTTTSTTYQDNQPEDIPQADNN